MIRLVVHPVGQPPEGTLRRALADAWHYRNCARSCNELDCGGRLDREELAALEAAARGWHTTHTDTPRR